ncbi:MAG: hypothetical protein ACOX9R_14210 [Armatimonadota bacterium]|jgi:hypothetical protein
MSLSGSIGSVGMVALCITVALPAFAQWAPGVDGYTQFRYEYSDSEGDGDFDTRRVRLNWRDAVNDAGTTVRIQLDFSDLLTGDGSRVSAKDIWVMHPFANGWSVLAGFTTVRFGYELEYSSSKRLPFERSQAARSFFPGERGIGAFVRYQSPESPNVKVDLAYIDGMDAWERGDFDDASSFVAKVEVPFGSGSAAGLSYMTSDVDLSTGGGAGVSPDVFGAHVRYNGSAGDNAWAVQAEYYDGDWYDHRNHVAYDADGWYAQLEFQPGNSPVVPFYRYDEFNWSASINAAQAAGNSAYSRHTLGVAYEPWTNNRFTLQIEDIDMASGGDTTVGVQWQVIYR